MTKAKSERLEQRPADRLREARIKAGFKRQSHFVEEFGLTQGSVSMHESGKRPINIDAAERYAEILGVTAEYIMFGSTPTPVSRSEDFEWLKPEAELCAGRWLSTEGPAPEPIASPHVRIPVDQRFPRERQRAYLMNGRSGGPSIPSGAIVNALTSCDSPELLPNGAHVVVRQLRDRGKLYELSLRIVESVTSKRMTLVHPAPNAHLDARSAQDIEVHLDRKSRTIEIIGRALSITTFLP